MITLRRSVCPSVAAWCGVESLTCILPWQACDKVHRQILPCTLRNRQGPENPIRGMAGSLGSFAWVAIAAEPLDIAAHPRSKVLAGDEFHGLRSPGVAGCWCIVV